MQCPDNKQCPVHQAPDISLFLRIRLFSTGSAQQIVYTDIVEVCQLYESIDGIIQNTDFVLGIGILTDSKIITDLLLGISVINSQTADVFEFQDFIAHIITQ